ncbi:MAG: hypothetical protein ABR955_07600 [Verrucomicrobiota bacterium]|jgi:hypothetical protein
MKHVSKNSAGKNVADVNAPKKQTACKPEPAANVDAAMEEIHLRANYVGPVLEGILRAGHERVHWDRYA